MANEAVTSPESRREWGLIARGVTPWGEGGGSPGRGQIPLEGGWIPPDWGQILPDCGQIPPNRGQIPPDWDPTRLGAKCMSLGLNPALLGPDPARLGLNPTRSGTDPTGLGPDPTRLGPNSTRFGLDHAKLGPNPAVLGCSRAAVPGRARGGKLSARGTPPTKGQILVGRGLLPGGSWEESFGGALGSARSQIFRNHSAFPSLPPWDLMNCLGSVGLFGV